MRFRDDPFFFDCEGERLPGIVSHPEDAGRVGVLIIVGGPQYRVGSHRQFVLLARALAENGVPSMRFDFRGAGDATGEQRTYEDIDADIAAAIDAFFARVPQLEQVVLWGLCGAASAALFYAHRDSRVAGLALVNPWVRTEEGMAKTYLRHYYVRRLLTRGFWRELLHGHVDPWTSAKSFAQMVGEVARGSWRRRIGRRSVAQGAPIDESRSLPARMATGLEYFGKDVLIVLSGADYTAQEFRTVITGDQDWDRAFAKNRLAWHEIPRANHTFASRKWRDEVATLTLHWVRNLAMPSP
jgi:exosortase A-associated hydrolase 1